MWTGKRGVPGLSKKHPLVTLDFSKIQHWFLWHQWQQRPVLSNKGWFCNRFFSTAVTLVSLCHVILQNSCIEAILPYRLYSSNCLLLPWWCNRAQQAVRCYGLSRPLPAAWHECSQQPSLLSLLTGSGSPQSCTDTHTHTHHFMSTCSVKPKITSSTCQHTG